MSREQMMGWALAAAAIAAGYVQWGWRGVLLGITVVVFWLLLQFSRALRAMRTAAGAPKGTVASAVMLHSRLKPGLHLTDLLRLTGSLGARVRVEFSHGRVSSWALQRPADAAPTPPEQPI
jgi:hypothetical protein